MARLLTFPDGLGLADVTWLSGPGARSSGSTTASDGSEQTFDTVGDVVSFRLDFTIKQGRGARRERGFLTALGGGSNAFRFTYVDADKLSPAEAGIVGSFGVHPWSNGKPWSNGQFWKPAYPTVPVAAPSAVDTGIINLGSQFWGHALGFGDYVGFFPFHFGAYMITEAIGGGQYRIWPRLRKAITPDDFCTLEPTLVVRPTSKEAATWKRNPSTTQDASVTLTEVIDPYVRAHLSAPATETTPPPPIFADGKWNDAGVWSGSESYP